jgi:hypothetical protein
MTCMSPLCPAMDAVHAANSTFWCSPVTFRLIDDPMERMTAAPPARPSLTCITCGRLAFGHPVWLPRFAEACNVRGAADVCDLRKSLVKCVYVEHRRREGRKFLEVSTRVPSCACDAELLFYVRIVVGIVFVRILVWFRVVQEHVLDVLGGGSGVL